MSLPAWNAQCNILRKAGDGIMVVGFLLWVVSINTKGVKLRWVNETPNTLLFLNFLYFCLLFFTFDYFSFFSNSCYLILSLFDSCSYSCTGSWGGVKLEHKRGKGSIAASSTLKAAVVLYYCRIPLFGRKKIGTSSV